MDDVRRGETGAIGESEVLLDMTAARSTPHGIEPVGARHRRQEQEPRLSADSRDRLDATSDHRQGEPPDLGCGREVQRTEEHRRAGHEHSRAVLARLMAWARSLAARCRKHRNVGQGAGALSRTQIDLQSA